MSKSFLIRTAEAACDARFVRDRKGGAAVMFALVSPLALLAIMGVNSYAFNLQYRADVKAAVDGAALTATQSLARDSNADVSAIGQAYFRANAPADALTNGAVTFAQTTDSNGGILVSGNYSGVTRQFLGGFLPFTSLRVSESSQLSLAYNSSTNSPSSSSSGGSSSGGGTISTSSGGSSSGGSTSGPGTYSGSGTISGSPSISVGGQTYTLACGPTAQWYNILSDGGMQVNASCLQDPNNPGASYINAVNILRYGHSIYTSAQTPNYVNGVPDYTSAPIWWGDVTIDGVYYPHPTNLPPSVNSQGQTVAGAACGSGDVFTPIFEMSNVCQTNYLGGVAQTTIEDLTRIYAKDNYVGAFGNGYLVYVVYGAGARAEIQLMANGVGAQGAPGGFWGQTLSGGTDNNPADFLLDATSPTGNSYQGASYPASVSDAGANGVGPQYAWSWPASGGGASAGVGNVGGGVGVGGLTNATGYGTIRKIQ